MSNEWFENWFDSPYYHTLYGYRDDAEAQQFLNKLTGYLEPNKNARFLDLACGKGRHAIHLNRKGFRVTGYDLSKNSIAIAKVYENERLKFKVCDMRDELGNSEYDYILNLFTSFGYFANTTDNIRVLSNVYKALRPNGSFILDYLNATMIEQQLIPNETVEKDGIKFEITRSIVKGFIIKNIEINDNGVKHVFQEKVKAFNLQELSSLFKAAKLKFTATFGDYDLRPFHDKSSNRLIIIAIAE